MTDRSMTLSDDSLGVGIYENVVVLDIRGAVELEHIRHLELTYTKLLKRHQQLVLLVVARRSIAAASGAVRAEGAQVAKKFGSAVKHMAIVIEDSGVVAELYRTLLRVFSVASRFVNIKVYASVEGAIKDVASMVAPDSPTNIEREVIREFRRLRSERSDALGTPSSIR